MSSSPSNHSSLTSCTEEPVVGGIFNGSVITNVEVEITDRGRNWKKRFLLTLEGGMLAIDDRYVPKSSFIEVEDFDGSCSSFHSFTFEGMELPESAKGINAIKEVEQLERQERRQHRVEKQKRRNSLKQQQKKDSIGDNKNNNKTEGTRKNNGTTQKPGKSCSDDTIVVDNTASKSSSSSGSSPPNKKKVAVISKFTKVVPATDPMTTDGGPRATWKFSSPTEVPIDAELWAPVDVCLLTMSKDDDSRSSIDQDLIESRGLNGVWGYAPRMGSRHEKPPTSSSRSLKSTSSSCTSRTSSSFKAAKDIWVYPPHIKPPADFPIHGTYKFAPVKNGKKKTKFQWPPPVDPVKKNQRRVNRLKDLPKLFSNSPATPMAIQAYSSKNEPYQQTTAANNNNKNDDDPSLISGGGQKRSETSLTGIWTYLDGQEQQDDEWMAQDVQLFPPGQSPTAAISDDDDDGENSSKLPQGTWVIYEDDANNRSTHQQSDAILQPHNSENQWIDSKQQPKVHLFPPGQNPDIETEPVIATGTWTYAKDSIKRKWPPPTKEEAKKLRKVGKVNIPKIFQQKPSRPLTVYSKDCPENPRSFDKGTRTKRPRSSNGDASAVTGQWAFFDGDNEDPNGDWKPVNVVIYAPDEIPPSKNDVQGIWTIHDADPEQICVHSPGFELDPSDDTLLASGVWAFHSGDDELSPTDDDWLTSWPPPKANEETQQSVWTPPGKSPQDHWTSHEIRVVISNAVSKVEGGAAAAAPVTGIWKFHDGPPDDFDEWLPQDLIVCPSGQELPSHVGTDGPTGLWGIHRGSKPNEDGVWDADQVWFFPPGEEDNVSEDCVIQGMWTYPPGQKNVDWPPKHKLMQQPKKNVTGNLVDWDPNGHGEDWKPQKVSVVPSNAAATEGGDGGPTGVWVFSDGQEPHNLDEWNALEVAVYPRGVDPDVNDGKPTGVWGYYKDAVPDEDGEWAADAIVFCAPGVEAGENIVVQGQWAFFDSDTEWPQTCEPFEAQELLPQEEEIVETRPKKKTIIEVSHEEEEILEISPRKREVVEVSHEEEEILEISRSKKLLSSKPPKPPKMVARKPEIVPINALLSPDRSKMRVLPVKSPVKSPFAEDERYVSVLGKYQSAFDVANRPTKPSSSKRLLIKKKYKK